MKNSADTTITFSTPPILQVKSAQQAVELGATQFDTPLTFRWYLGMTSRWARTGESDRKRDYQVWCGPAMGGFNTWAQGTQLEKVKDRTVVGIADALMEGAAVEARRSVARAQGALT